MDRILLLLVVAAWLGGPGPAPAETLFDIQGIFWFATPTGDGSVGFEGVEGTDFDLEDDLGYGDREGIPGVRAAVGSRHRLVGELLQLDISADNTVDRSIRFEDVLFRVNTDVSSEVEALLARVHYQLTLKSEQASLGLILGGQYVDLEARAEAVDVGRASASLTAALPYIGAGLRLSPHPRFELAASGVGSSWDIGDVEATFLDFEISAAFQWEILVVGAGYRHLIIDAEDSDEPIRADLTFSGPIAYAGLAW